MNAIRVPDDYDYVGIYLTNACHLSCEYCITRHFNSRFGAVKFRSLTADEWVAGISRLKLPNNIPISLQGGEPFLYKGIRDVLERIECKADVLTALPPHINRDYFASFKTLDWNRREAPYPRIRVSYHKGQNNFKDLVDRISTFNDLVSIGIYYLKHPSYNEDELKEMRDYAASKGVELRCKEFLGDYKGSKYGEFLYQEACDGIRKSFQVKCRNTVVPIGPDGTIYRCHSDLYFNRKEFAIGNILDESVVFPGKSLPCDNYGLCSECDVKVKTNHLQVYGYTSATIELPDKAGK